MKSRALERGNANWTKRVVLGGLGTAGASIALAALAASAFANAANPVSASSTETVNADHTVSVTVSGDWSWAQLAGVQSSPQNDCTGRSGVGWSVDWWGMTTSQTPTAGMGPTSGSQYSAATSKTSGPAALPSTTPLSVAGTWQVKSGVNKGLYFHTSHLFNGFTTDLCSSTVNGNGNGAPIGHYSATALYPSLAAVPAKICVNFYDPHGSQGSFSTSSGDNYADDANDNSITTNSFDPANVQGNCSTPVLQNPTMSVDKTNNAQGGVFQDVGQASSLSQDVTFRAIISNTSPVALTIDTVKDAIPTGQANPGPVSCLTAAGHNVVGDTLAPKGQAGDSETCFFTVPNYLAANGIALDGNLVDDVIVTGHSSNGTPVQADDTSKVLAPPSSPNIGYAKTGPATGLAGGTGDYTITLTNSGTGTANGPLNFVDVLPVGETFNSVQPVSNPAGSTTSAGMSCSAGPVTASGQLVSCSYANNLAKNASASVVIRANFAAGTEGQSLRDCTGNTQNTANVCWTTNIPQPNLVITKDGPGTGVPGGSGSYTITVTNNGQAPANSVSFVDQLPADESFVSAAGGDFNCTVDTHDATKINCTAKSGLLPLAVHGSLSVNVLVTYALTSQEGEHLTDCAILPNLNQDCATTIIHKPDVTILKTGPATGTAGGQGVYTIQVKNTGQATANNVTFTDSLPAGESYVSFSSSAITCSLSANPQIVNCSVNGGSLAPGASASVDVTIAYGANTGGQTLTDCAILMTGNESCVPTKIPSPPSISVVKTNDANGDGVFHDTEQADAPGDSVPFKVVVTNTSADPLVIDSVSDTWPGLANALAECPDLIGMTLQSGDSVTCTFTVDNYAPAAGDSLTNTITVTGHQTPGGTPVTGTDTSTVITKVPSPIDLAIVKNADKATVKEGDTLTYTLAVTNVGTGATTGPVTVTDTLPDGLDYNSIDGGTAWDCTVSGQDISCTYLNGSLAAGEAAPLITVVTTVNSTAVGVVINTGVVDTPGDVNPANNRSTVKTPVIKVLPEKVTKPPTQVLPFTGDRTGSMIPVGILAVLAGLLLMVAGRRRRTN